MMGIVLKFLLSAVVIVIAGTFLSRTADRFAELTGFGRLLVGSILLAGATSLPELFIDVSAVRMGMPDLAVGNLIGSCLLNLLVLAIADLVNRQNASLFSRKAGAHALAACMSIALISIAGIAIMSAPFTGGWSFLGLGAGSMGILLGYGGGIRMVYFDQRLHASMEQEEKTQVEKDHKRRELSKCLGIFFLAALAIFFAAPHLADSAGDIAEATGLAQSFIGTVLVSLCTVLPELVATISCIRMGCFDLALGNIFGSNAFNMVVLALVDFFHQGPLLADVSPIHVLTALSVILCTTVAVIGQLYNVERRQRFIEPDAFLIMALVFGCMGLLYKLSSTPF